MSYMKKGVGLLLVMVVYFSVNGIAQTMYKPNFKTMDSITYQAFIDEDWNQVLKVGNEALKHHIDYYYLRMRMGGAAYELGYLPQSARHYEKALLFNNNDPTAQIYLYNVYLMLNKKPLAYKLSSDFNSYTSQQIPNKIKTVESITAGGGVSLSNNYTKNDATTFLNESNSFAQQVLYGDKQIFYAGIPINLSPVLRFYFGFTHLAIKKRTRNQYIEYPLKTTSTLYEHWGFQRTFSTEAELMEKTFDSQVFQNELYFNLRLQLKNRWSASLFGSLISVNTSFVVADSTRTYITDTNYYFYDTGEVGLMQYNYLATQFFIRDTSLLDYTLGLHIEKDLLFSTLGFTGITSSINGYKQTQLSLQGFYYIGKGVNFFGTTEGIYFRQKGWGSVESRTILRQAFGAKLYKLSWLEAEAIWGDLNDATLYNGLVVYNHVDKMKYRIGLSVIALFGPHVELSLRYQYLSLQGDYMQEVDAANENKTHTFAYEAQNFIGGLKWTF